MPRSRLFRALLVALSLASFAGASQATFCPDVERCVMAGAKADGVAPACAPEMGGDCCKEGETPAGAPSQDGSAQARASLVATTAEPVAAVVIPTPSFRPAESSTAARPPAAVPLYTLLATLLI